MDKLKFRRGGWGEGGGVKISIQSTVSTSEDFKMTSFRSTLQHRALRQRNKDFINISHFRNFKREGCNTLNFLFKPKI